MQDVPPEGPSALGTVLVPHFYPSLCHICRASSPTLKRCGGCKLVAYCSPEHQKEHWGTHKPMCTVVNKLIKSRGQSSLLHGTQSLTKLEWNTLRSTLIAILEQKMGRSLLTDEAEMLQFPRVCLLCRNDDQSMLQDCVNCLSVAFCSEHSSDRVQHDLSCFYLRLTKLMYLYEMQNGAQFPKLPDRISASYRPLPDDLFALMSEAYSYNSTCCEALKNQVHSILDISSYTAPIVQLVSLSERLSFPLSVLYALEQITQDGCLFDFKSCSKLVMHIVGSEMIIEGVDLKKWLVFLHRLPKLKRLKLIFIGPDLGSESTYTSLLDRRKITFEMAHGFLYHDYVQSPIYVRPDVVVAFNCGIHEAPPSNPFSWSPSLPFLLQPSVPFVLTSYTLQECEADVARICESVPEAGVVLTVRKNPFRSQRPFRDWADDDDSQVFSLNAYIAALMRGIC